MTNETILIQVKTPSVGEEYKLSCLAPLTRVRVPTPGRPSGAGKTAGYSLILKPVKHGCHRVADTLAGQCSTRALVPGTGVNGMTGNSRPNAGNLRFSGVLFLAGAVG